MPWTWLHLLACVADDPGQPPGGRPGEDDPAETTLPAGLPDVVVTTSSEGSQVAGGYVLVSLVSEAESFVGVVDGTGAWVWAVAAPPDQTFASPRLGLDGATVLYASYPRDRASDDGSVVRVGLDGSVVSETFTTTAHHMFAEQGDGTFAWLSLEGRTVPWDGGELPVLADRILVAPEGSAEAAPATVFSYFDDVGEPYVPCEHAAVAIDRFGWHGYFEWTHSNSLVHLPDDGTWLISSRHTDGILRIDAATGDVLWQLGGRDATLVVEDPAMLPSHPHLSDAWGDGALVFDNGVHRVPQTSRVVRWSFDGAAGTATPEWVYEPADGRYTYMLGDARRLPGDHVLVAWALQHELEEVTAEGDVVWAAEVQGAWVLGRVGFLADLPAP